jgi:hypothetical protein
MGDHREENSATNLDYWCKKRAVFYTISAKICESFLEWYKNQSKL